MELTLRCIRILSGAIGTLTSWHLTQDMSFPLSCFQTLEPVWLKSRAPTISHYPTVPSVASWQLPLKIINPWEESSFILKHTKLVYQSEISILLWLESNPQVEFKLLPWDTSMLQLLKITTIWPRSKLPEEWQRRQQSLKGSSNPFTNSTFGTNLCLGRISTGSHKETMSGESLSSLGLWEKSPPQIILFTRRVSKTGKILDT